MKTNILKKYVWILITLFFLSCGFKEDQKDRQEQIFIQELNEMLDNPEYGLYYDEIMDSIFDLITDNPQSLEYEFDDNSLGIRIATSDDGNVRVYNLEVSRFGGNPSLGFICRSLLQYKSGESVFCKEIRDFNGYITHIRHIDSNKYYLLEDYQGSCHQGTYENTILHLYKIENDSLQKVKRAFENRNDVSDNFEFSWNDMGGSIDLDFEKKDSLVIYSRAHKELYVVKGMPLRNKPLKYYQYYWKGHNFELRKYDEPKEFYNEKFFIRIEQNSEDFWTYKCWNGGKKKGEPDLIIKSGTKQYWSYSYDVFPFDEWAVDDDSSPMGVKYTFYNNGYCYVYCHGWKHGCHIDELYVYDPNEMIIYRGDFESVSQP